MKILTAWKREGLTPYQLAQLIKQKELYKDLKLGFAGRLDPMAEGLMIFLVDEENKKRKDYEKLEKEYEFEVLFGISSDTYDILGIPSLGGIVSPSSKDLDLLTKSFIGKRKQKYPPYSYPKVNGKALYWWARNGRLSEIKIPEKTVEIFGLDFIDQYKINSNKLVDQTLSRIERVSGDFRQEEIIKAWQSFRKENRDLEFTVARFRISCSSGTYIRGIADKMGKVLKTGALAHKIVRTRVGKYTKKSVIFNGG